jgi:hypothetical protein
MAGESVDENNTLRCQPLWTTNCAAICASENNVLDGGLRCFIQHGEAFLVDFEFVRHRTHDRPHNQRFSGCTLEFGIQERGRGFEDAIETSLEEEERDCQDAGV